ncbi:hypothetical protein TrST_g4442 [Triparma strigata]|uniref:Uncharacterized protein n=1 Tax=Triparma strigata TaxID=1606541 RepID=A0A9W7EIA6_9STRA|nr:hypothetical protein TrST_g4442 [Triparma strigata]
MNEYTGVENGGVDYIFGVLWIEVGDWKINGGDEVGEESIKQDGGRLVLIGGSFTGDLRSLAVTPSGLVPIPNGDFKGGHSSVVRCLGKVEGGYVTGGEDGRVCLWSNTGGGAVMGGLKKKKKKKGKGKNLDDRKNRQTAKPY